MGEQFGQRCDTCRGHDHHQSDVEEWPEKEEYGRRCDSVPCRHATTCTSPGLAYFRSARLTTSTARSLLIDSGNRPLSAVAFPFCVFLALVGQTNPQAPILDPEVQMEILPASLQPHPPVIVRHLLKMNDSARGNNFVKCGPSIRQLVLRPNFQRTAVLLPNHVAIIDHIESSGSKTASVL